MQVTTEIIFQLITLFFTALSFVWYMANQLGSIRSRLDKIESTLEALSKVEKGVEGLSAKCREGRIQIWASFLLFLKLPTMIIIKIIESLIY